ncbi:MAG: cytochrome c biogenesis protein, partial [Gammaproteobacteria bacterium]|nr:cytochrome c biogenesis protein [Gammaproteobacteria bacterium]
MSLFSKAFWLQLSSPKVFYPIAGKMIPWFAVLAAVLCVIGLYFGFVVAPIDYQQGNSYRIMFIHVPAAWMSMFIYIVMCVYAAIGLIWNTRLSN